MNVHTVGILSPGDMGHAIGNVLHHHGMRVITCLRDRSPRTAALATKAGMIDVADDDTLVREADIFLSILPPAQASTLAERIAAAVQRTQADLLFADCNAISPRTTLSIEKLITTAGARFVDIGIIGAPPRPDRQGPRLYASGPHATDVAPLTEYGLDVRVLGPQSGQASGLKMCYASLTKGLTALATQALVAAEALGLTETLTGELHESQAQLLGWFERQVLRMPPEAYRWVGEMRRSRAPSPTWGCRPRCWRERRPSTGWWNRRSWARRPQRSDTGTDSGGGRGYPGGHAAA